MSSLSHFERFQVQRAVSRKQNSTTSDLVTAAIVMSSTGGIFGGIARMKARSLWAAAKEKVPSKVAEQLVLHSLDVGDALARITSATKMDEFSNGERMYMPLEVLACGVVKERLMKHLGKLFVEAVSGEEEGVVINGNEEEQERRMTIDAARELGGSVDSLGRLFERVWKTYSVDLEDVTEQFTCVGSDSISESVDGEIKSLFTALVLYRRLFDGDDVSSSETECASCMSSSTPTMARSSLLSPPPSPRTTAQVQTLSRAMQMNTRRREQNRTLLELRKALGSRVFEDGACTGAGQTKEMCVVGLEDARDRVVDLVVDLERNERADLSS